MVAPAGMAHALHIDRRSVRRRLSLPFAVQALRLEGDVSVRVLRDPVPDVPQDGPAHLGRRVLCGWLLISTSASVAADRSPLSRADWR